LSHSHIALRHLLKQVELYKQRRKQRDVRPAWVTEFINKVADLFEPMQSEVGRVGFDCRFLDETWAVDLFLGSTELVGGRHDGQSRHTSFSFDLAQLLEHFESVERFQWLSIAEGDAAEGVEAGCAVVMEGHVGSNPLRLAIRSAPPDGAGPGFRVYPNGTRDMA
jgi:hypothetical protein